MNWYFSIRQRTNAKRSANARFEPSYQPDEAVARDSPIRQTINDRAGNETRR
jgi:hypothetical protein